MERITVADLRFFRPEEAEEARRWLLEGGAVG